MSGYACAEKRAGLALAPMWILQDFGINGIHVSNTGVSPEGLYQLQLGFRSIRTTSWRWPTASCATELTPFISTKPRLQMGGCVGCGTGSGTPISFWQYVPLTIKPVRKAVRTQALDKESIGKGWSSIRAFTKAADEIPNSYRCVCVLKTAGSYRISWRPISPNALKPMKATNVCTAALQTNRS